MQLYRFEKILHFLDMLTNGRVAFSHPSAWDDPYESVFLTSGQLVRHAMVLGPDGQYHSGLPRHPHSTTAHIGMINPFANLVFAQCFGEHAETERTWNALRHEQRVRWSVDSERYLDAVRLAVGNRFLTLRKVNYRDDEDVREVHQRFVTEYGRGMSIRKIDAWSEALTEPLTTKRRGFWDEGEQRFILVDSKHLREHSSQTVPPPFLLERKHFPIEIPLRDLVTDVMLPPKGLLTDKITLEARIRETGYYGPILQSSLYSRPQFDIVREKPVVEP